MASVNADEITTHFAACRGERGHSFPAIAPPWSRGGRAPAETSIQVAISSYRHGAWQNSEAPTSSHRRRARSAAETIAPVLRRTGLCTSAPPCRRSTAECLRALAGRPRHCGRSESPAPIGSAQGPVRGITFRPRVVAGETVSQTVETPSCAASLRSSAASLNVSRPSFHSLFSRRMTWCKRNTADPIFVQKRPSAFR